MFLFFFFFKQKTAYEMRISDWSSDVCSSDLTRAPHASSVSSRRSAFLQPTRHKLLSRSAGNFENSSSTLVSLDLPGFNSIVRYVQVSSIRWVISRLKLPQTASVRSPLRRLRNARVRYAYAGFGGLGLRDGKDVVQGMCVSVCVDLGGRLCLKQK